MILTGKWCFGCKGTLSLEYSAGSGANAWVLGAEDVIVEVEAWNSYTSETPDFWRRAKADYPSHAGRFTGLPAYFKHIYEASKGLMEKINTKPQDYTYAVFHMPNGTFPLKIAQSLGFSKEQILPSYIVPKVGNSYSASALMGLVATLEIAKPNDRIFFASYGSGAGSDALSLKATDKILNRIKPFKLSIENKTYIDYATYMKFMHMM